MNKKGLILTGVALLLGGISAYAKMQYDLSKKLVYSVGKVKLIKAGILNTVLSIKLNIDNTDRLKAEVKDLKLDLYADGVFLTSVNKPETFFIKPNDRTEVDTDVSINVQKLITEGKGLISSVSQYKQIPITFDLKFKVKKLGFWIPLKFKFTYTVEEMM